MLKIDRRAFVTACAAGLVLAPGAFAQQTVNLEELHAPGQLGEMALGSAEAPVTVVEYASMSCPHCAHFHRTTFPEFKEKYIDTGKVRFIFREFPLNAPAYAASMVARCAPADRYFDVVDAYFERQDGWLSSQNLRNATFEVAQDFGFTEQTFDACVRNQALFTGLEAVKNRGVGFGVQATPTFFIEGRKMEGALSLADLDKALEPLL
jgi:protein-disulfide isomerase